MTVKTKRGILRFACGATMPSPDDGFFTTKDVEWPGNDAHQRKRDGWLRFCVYDAHPGHRTHMPRTTWPGKPDRKTDCFINCPAEELKVKKAAGRKVERHFGPKRPGNDKGPGLYHYVTCHAEWVPSKDPSEAHDD